MRIRTALRRLRAARVLSAMVVVALAGSVAVAMGAIPSSTDGTVHLCYDTKDATSDRGGADLSIVDGQANTKGCSLGESALSINQRGPQGVPGNDSTVPGPPGPAGGGIAYATDGGLTINDVESKTVVSKTLPAGSYAITASALLENMDRDGESFASCSLYRGATKLDAFPDFRLARFTNTGDKASEALQGVLSDVGNGTVVSVVCGEAGAGVSVNATAHLTATKVAGIQ